MQHTWGWCFDLQDNDVLTTWKIYSGDSYDVIEYKQYAA